jgi:hypothetical protein
MPTDLRDTVIAVAEAALRGRAPEAPQKKRGLSAGRAMLLGAGLATVGHAAIGARGRDLLSSVQQRLLDRPVNGRDDDPAFDDDDYDEESSESEAPEGEGDEDFDDEDFDDDDDEGEHEDQEEPDGEGDEDFDDEDFDDEEEEDPDEEDDEPADEVETRRRTSRGAGGRRRARSRAG